MSVCAHSFHLHVIHDVCLIVRSLSVSSCLSFSCFSPSFTSSLPYSTCTLTSTSSPMSTASRDIPDWLQEFRENLVDDRVLEHRDSHASSSHGSSSEPTPARSADLGKHSIYTHFPKDRNCEICQRTKITRAPCRRCIGGAVPSAEKFGDFITADHKVLSEGCEFRNNHRYAIVVQEMATQWIQSHSCKTKTSQETQRRLQKFLEPNGKPKVIYTDNSLEFGKACEDLSWNHCTSTPHRSETNGIAERGAFFPTSAWETETFSNPVVS